MSSVRCNVVVGIDASREALVAARYAVWQAETRGLDLLLVHAYPLPPIESTMAGDMVTCLREAAEAVVAEVIAKLAIPPSVHVTTMVGQTAPIILLEQAAESARLVVVGQDHIGFFERLLVGSVASPLCKEAKCPVVVVPRMWRQGPMDVDPVVVALAGRSAAVPALQLAFEEAALSSASVVALHAVRISASAAEVADDERNLAELLAGFRSAFPDVDVTIRTVVGDPDRVIVESSLNASMLVVSSPHARGPAAWMRSVARQVLNRTQCPVAVIPRQADSRRRPGAVWAYAE